MNAIQQAAVQPIRLRESYVIVALSPIAGHGAEGDRREPRPGRSCPAGKWDLPGNVRVFGVSGGARVLVDQAAEDGFAVDPFAVEVGNGEVAIVVFAVGDALGDALVRPGRAR